MSGLQIAEVRESHEYSKVCKIKIVAILHLFDWCRGSSVRDK